MVILPKLSPAALVPLVKPKNRYYVVILPKLSSAALEPCLNLKTGIIWSLQPKLSSAALVPLFQPKNSYYMVISPKLSSATHISLVSSFLNWRKGQKGQKGRSGKLQTLRLPKSPKVKTRLKIHLKTRLRFNFDRVTCLNQTWIRLQSILYMRERDVSSEGEKIIFREISSAYLSSSGILL